MTYYSKLDKPCNKFEPCQAPELKTTVCLNCGYTKKQHTKTNLTPRQKEILRKLRNRELYLIAEYSENCWRSGMVSYIDDRVKSLAHGLLREFHAANKDAVTK